MKESFLYLFKDNKWVVKFLTAFVFILTYTYGGHFYLVNPKHAGYVLQFKYWLPMAMGCLLAYTIISGYKIICVKAFKINQQYPIAPFLRLKIAFLNGFKYLCASGLFHFCCLFLIGIFGIMTGISIGTGNRALSLTLLIILVILLILYSLYWVLTEFGYIYMFSEKPEFLTFFRIKELFNYIGNNKGIYFRAVGLNYILIIMLSFLFVIINILLLQITNHITELLLNSGLWALCATYIFYVSSMLIAKSLENK